MKPFTRHTGLVVPIDRPNVDTDAIIPKQFLKAINRTGFGVNLFDEWRYLDKGEPGMDCSTRPINSEFSLNFPQFKGASILIARENFGCGSSREHAVWALDDYGIRVVLAPTYSDIFFNNCFKNGVLPIRLSEQEIDHIFKAIDQEVGFELTVDLEKQQVCYANQHYSFEIDAFRKHCLLNGLDDIGLTLTHSQDILMYETKRKAEAPWLFV